MTVVASMYMVAVLGLLAVASLAQDPREHSTRAEHVTHETHSTPTPEETQTETPEETQTETSCDTDDPDNSPRGETGGPTTRGETGGPTTVRGKHPAQDTRLIGEDRGEPEYTPKDEPEYVIKARQQDVHNTFAAIVGILVPQVVVFCTLVYYRCR
ncbi:uncharacterized protein LOC131943476 [Physella acuta]|uniref:uncharacterized protein LOC131943476 n=1 Tax=Physella acuta TaxID=109671 RepID=UPI0027DAD248|nr:uncharacterized protein LOC131943476 [Physella acuta]